MLWGFSLQFWQVIVFWLWAASAVGGGVAVVAALGSSVISYYITDATEAAAKVEIGNAKATAGQANETAGRANERAAVLEKEAAEARLEQEKIARSNLEMQQVIEKERSARLELERDVGEIKPQVKNLMPMRLAEEARYKMWNILSKTPGRAAILHDMGSAATRLLADDLRRVVVSSGWQASHGSVAGLGGEPAKTGLIVRVNKGDASPAQKAFVEALSAAGIPFDLRREMDASIPHMNYLGPGAMPDDVELTVTIRPH